MRISVSVTNYSWPDALTSNLVDVAHAADEGGLDTVWVPDHLIQADPNLPDDDEMLEAYTTLGFLAAHTSRIRLGTMVTAVTYRPPAMLIKAVTTADVLSGGRAWLGVGAGYHQSEAELLGVPLPPTAQRFARLEETLRLADRMWSQNKPLPASRPRPPVLIGGMGEKHTLRLVARYADACNLFDIPDGGGTIRHKLDVLRSHCADVARPYEQIDKTVSTRWLPDESPRAFAERCAALKELGIQHAVVITDGPWTPDTVATLAEAVPHVADL